jgi:hypothetical protein
MVTELLGVVAFNRAGVNHARLRRPGTEERLPNGCRSFEPTAVRQSVSTKVLKTLLVP